MNSFSTSALLPIIQLAITPVILISGVGALMLSLTNRMGRIVDRTRNLALQVQQADADSKAHLETQLDILWRRASYLLTPPAILQLSRATGPTTPFFSTAQPSERMLWYAGLYLLVLLGLALWSISRRDV